MGIVLLSYVNDRLESFPLIASVQITYSLALVHVDVFARLTSKLH
jgi:hypothetical protein